ncbi:MAG: hypothetical protein PVTTEEND_002212 [Candidatus Fervidibacter sp.]
MKKMTTAELEEQVNQWRRRLTEAGVWVLTGNWGGKGGIARYKGRWLVVIDRNLPPAWKLRLLQTVAERLQAERTDNAGAPDNPAD